MAMAPKTNGSGSGERSVGRFARPTAAVTDRRPPEPSATPTRRTAAMTRHHKTPAPRSPTPGCAAELSEPAALAGGHRPARRVRR